MKRTQKKGLLAALTVIALILALVIPAAAGPVGNAAGFEDDDGNLVDDSPVFDPGPPATGDIDWNNFNTSPGSRTWTGTAPTRQADGTANGWIFRGIEDWQATTSDSAFAGGTKQDDDCPTVNTGKAPNKDDLKRIYLASKVVGGRTYLMLAWVRIPQNTTSPSAHVGFEFNKGDTPCGASSDGLVQRTLGDMLVVYDFEGGAGDTPVITIRRWVTSGSCEVGSKSPPCWGPATDVTALGFAEAKVNTFGPVSDTVAPSSETLGTSEFGEAGIDLTGAGVFGANACESFGKAFGVSRSSGNSGTAQMKDLVGPTNFRLANCATVIIHKQTSPDEDPNTTDFGYTTNVSTTPATTTSPFTLQDDGTKTIENVNPASGLNVTEDDPGPGYALTSIDCSASTVPSGNYSTDTTTRAVKFSIAGGETLECTFTNAKVTGALRILKNSTKGGAVSNAGAVFSYDDSSVTDNGAGDEDSDVGEVCVSGLTIGTYTVNETSPPSGYGGAPASEADQSVSVVGGTNCTDNLPGSSGTATFTNAPLSDIQVNFRDGGSGETSATITCDNATGTGTDTAATGWDTSRTVTGVEAPTTITCTIEIDP